MQSTKNAVKKQTECREIVREIVDTMFERIHVNGEIKNINKRKITFR